MDGWTTGRTPDGGTDRLRWSVPCADLGQQDHTVRVLVMGDRVAVVLPPGDTLILTPVEAENIADLLDKAADYAVTES